MARFGLAGTVPAAGHRFFDVGDRSHIEDRWRSNMNTRPVSRRRWGISAFTALAVAGLTISLTTPTQAAPITNLIQNPGFVSTNSHTTQIQVNNPLPAPQPTFTAGADFGRAWRVGRNAHAVPDSQFCPAGKIAAPPPRNPGEAHPTSQLLRPSPGPRAYA